MNDSRSGINRGDVESYSAWQKYEKTGDSDVRNNLIRKHLSLVKYEAKRLKNLLPDFISLEDLESYGIIGLIQAIDRFKSDEGVKFATFARRRVRGAMIDQLRELDWLPHSMRRDCKKIMQAREKLKGELGREPDEEELACETSLSRERVKKLGRYLNSSQWLSLDSTRGESTMYDLLSGDYKSPFEHIRDARKKEVLAEAIKKLDEEEQLMLSLYYRDGLTQQEIAEVMDLTSSRVSQLHKKSVQKLRGLLSHENEFLGG